MRIVSLIPSATEIVAALGLRPELAGISHECDYPAGVESLPRVTYCPIYNAGLTSAQIDQAVRESIARGESLYRIDTALMREIDPDFVLTQGLCDVCAIGYDTVEQSLANSVHQSPHPGADLPRQPRILNLEARSLADLYGNIRDVASAAGVPERAEALVREMEARVAAVRQAIAATETRPRVLFLEWIDPPFGPGHWTPELIEIAGGTPVVGKAGVPSITLDWNLAVEGQPEVIVVACCGYDLEKIEHDYAILQGYPGWNDFPAVQNGRVHLIDGNQYFNRPGPRLVDSLEMLARAIHPEAFAPAESRASGTVDSALATAS